MSLQLEQNQSAGLNILAMFKSKVSLTIMF